MSPARPALVRTVLACAAALALLTAGAVAQVPSSDPRDGEDPRVGEDPRTGEDPRAAEKDPYALLTGKELYDALLKAGEDGKLKQAFHDEGWQILGYIDSRCEGWLALKEGGALATEEGKKQADDMQAEGRRLAAMADLALGDTRLVTYVTNFYGWNDEQQKRFREGQKLYRQAASIAREARSPEEALNALSPLQQSLGHARALGDTWGQTMALTLMGRIQADNKLFTECIATMREAVKLGREIRDIDAVWNGLAVQFETAVLQQQYEPAHDALQEQYLVARQLNDAQTEEKIVKQLVELDKAFDRG